jgi:hypothetical protein
VSAWTASRARKETQRQPPKTTTDNNRQPPTTTDNNRQVSVSPTLDGRRRILCKRGQHVLLSKQIHVPPQTACDTRTDTATIVSPAGDPLKSEKSNIIPTKISNAPNFHSEKSNIINEKSNIINEKSSLINEKSSII